MKKRFFVTATGTDIGKSFITAALVRQAKALNRQVMAYKPVISGFDITRLDESDTGVILESLQQPPALENVERISPWRFKAALSPFMAAREEGRAIDFDAVTAYSRTALAGAEDLILVEGIGGVMVPMDERHTVLDWIAALDVPVLLVTGNYLGTLSHTLTALAALHQRQIPVHALIVNESAPSPIPLAATIEELGRWAPMQILGVKHRASRSLQGVSELDALLG